MGFKELNENFVIYYVPHSSFSLLQFFIDLSWATKTLQYPPESTPTFSKVEHLDEARKPFDEMPERDNFICTIMLWVHVHG